MPVGVRMASSPSARKWMLRVWWSMPGTSEARKYSPSPRPRTAGGPKRAATSLSGSLAERTPMAKAPVRRRTARRTASSSGMEGAAESVRTDSALLASGDSERSEADPFAALRDDNGGALRDDNGGALRDGAPER